MVSPCGSLAQELLWTLPLLQSLIQTVWETAVHIVRSENGPY